MATTDHLRRQIRDAVVTLLTGLADTGANVFASRTRPAEEDRLPCILVYTRAERAELIVPDTAGVKEYGRALTLMVEAIAQGADTDDQLDAIAQRVETALEADPELGGLAWDTTLQGTDIVQSGDGRREGGSIRLTYEIIYHASAADPSTPTGG